MSRFGHSLEWIHAKGRVKVLCRPCGAASKWLASKEEGKAWALAHCKLREQRGHQRPLDEEKLPRFGEYWESRP